MSDAELDKLVAEKVMAGRVSIHDNMRNRPWCWNGSCDIFSPSTNIADAMEVLERFETYEMGKEDGHWCRIYHNESEHITDADTLPKAICLAALKAVGEEEALRWLEGKEAP